LVLKGQRFSSISALDAAEDGAAQPHGGF